MPYGTLIDFRTYGAARGLSVVETATDAEASAALERASDYIRTRYVIRFSDTYDGTEPQVEEATYIAAVLELSTPGLFSKVFTPAEAKILTGVGDMRWTPIAQAGYGADGMTPLVPMIENLLLPLTAFGQPVIRVV